MDYGIWSLNMEYGKWDVECGMDSAGDCCSEISRCIFDAQGIGDIWDADRIEGRVWSAANGKRSLEYGIRNMEH